MIIERLFKTLIVFFLAIFCLSVAVDNIVDYQVNLEFVKHVVSMDTMKPGFDTAIALSRGTSNQVIHAVMFSSIIASEFIAGFLALFSCVKMLMTINDNLGFLKSKRIYLIAAAVMISLWYFGFNIIASNWFYMWANLYDGQQTAYNFSIFILLSTVYIMRDEAACNEGKNA